MKRIRAGKLISDSIKLAKKIPGTIPPRYVFLHADGKFLYVKAHLDQVLYKDKIIECKEKWSIAVELTTAEVLFNGRDVDIEYKSDSVLNYYSGKSKGHIKLMPVNNAELEDFKFGKTDSSLNISTDELDYLSNVSLNSGTGLGTSTEVYVIYYKNKNGLFIGADDNIFVTTYKNKNFTSKKDVLTIFPIEYFTFIQSLKGDVNISINESSFIITTNSAIMSLPVIQTEDRYKNYEMLLKQIKDFKVLCKIEKDQFKQLSDAITIMASSDTEVILNFGKKSLYAKIDSEYGKLDTSIEIIDGKDKELRMNSWLLQIMPSYLYGKSFSIKSDDKTIIFTNSDMTHVVALM